MYHPDRARFFQDYIPFTKYHADELVLDFGEEDEKKLEKSRATFEEDTYPDIEGFTPQGWVKKQQGVYTNRASEFVGAFQPEYNQEACKVLIDAKINACKSQIEPDHKGHCRKGDSYENLKKKHDIRMKCRNLRLLESFSNCKTDRDKWIVSNGIGHTKASNNLANGAENCVNIYNRKKQKSSKKRRKARASKSRSRSKSRKSRSRSKSRKSRK